MNLNGFERHFDAISRRYSAYQAWDDFLSICICCFSIDPLSGKSRYEDEYMEIIGKYDKEIVREHFPKLMGELIALMEKHRHGFANDVLGEFHQQHFAKGARKAQYFTPEPVTTMMASIVGLEDKTDKRLDILDPACGSGRMLLSAASASKCKHNYYGIDLDPACCKMAAINFFLNGIPGEIMCGNALLVDDFQFSYVVKPYLFSLVRVREKAHSLLFNMHCNSFSQRVEKEKEETVDKKGQRVIVF